MWELSSSPDGYIKHMEDVGCFNNNLVSFSRHLQVLETSLQR